MQKMIIEMTVLKNYLWNEKKKNMYNTMMYKGKLSLTRIKHRRNTLTYLPPLFPYF